MATSARQPTNHVDVGVFRQPAVYTEQSYAAYVESLNRHDVTCEDIKDSFAGSTHKDTLVASVDVLRSRAYVSMGGAVSFDREVFPEIDIWWADPGSLAVNYQVSGLTLRSGVCAIVGGGGVGKTPLAHALAAAAGRYAVVRFSEPFAGYLTNSDEAAFQLAHALVAERAVVFDSAKDILAGGGNAMKSGLSRDALSTLSSWSIAAANAGCTLFVPVNPSTSDEETRRVLVEALRSNVSAVMYSNGREDWEYSCRTREGGMRTEGSLKAIWADGQLKLTSAGLRTPAAGPLTMMYAHAVEPGPVHRAMLASLQSSD